VRSNLKFQSALRLDTADRAANWLAQSAATSGDLNYRNKVYALLDKLTAADLSAFARRHLVETNQTTISLSTAQKEVAK